jgi:adenosylcobinamide-phosphate synthase
LFIKFLYPSPKDVILALILGLLLDIIYPEHKGILLKIHPVHTSYFCSLRLAGKRNSKIWWVLIWFLCTAVHIIPLILILYIIWLLPQDMILKDVLWIIMSGITFKLSFSPTLLLRTCLNIYKNVMKDNIKKAKELTQGLVRRDVSKLDLPHVLSAAIESLAESFVDGVLSPLFYFLLFGPLGALLQRIANTLDGAIGFKTREFREVGFFSAKVDDVINYVPARLSVILILICSKVLCGSLRGPLRTWRKYRSVTESPNAGHPMSVIAGSLGVWLEKIEHYKINPGGRDPRPEDLLKAIKIIICALVLSLLLGLGLLIVPIIKK